MSPRVLRRKTTTVLDEQEESTATKTSLAVALFEGIVALDVAGPMEAFATAHFPSDDRGGKGCYELLTIGLTKKLVVAEPGLILKQPDRSTGGNECCAKGDSQISDEAAASRRAKLTGSHGSDILIDSK